MKLPLEEVHARPYSGWLYLGRDPRVTSPQEVVRLLRSERDQADVVEPMLHPLLRKIDRGGILLRGLEEVRSGVTQPQVWWCLPGPLDDTTA
ncbi:MAG: hypothetical protein EON54_27475 [Alcaligenaceae bacterium]|nr:MAG: hypothetical protein EON54_27475 [Alcaligenaceae bacterium]